MKNDISFPDWLKDFVGSDDAVGVFADWLFSSKAKNRASALVKINKINSIQAWLVESKAPKHIKACFVSAWRSYQQWDVRLIKIVKEYIFNLNSLMR